MKQTPILVTFVLAACCAHGQGTFQFDQGVNPINAPGGYVNIQPNPTGESFVPTLSSVGFAQFYFTDANDFNGIGATIYVNLWSGSLTDGTLLGTTTPVSLPDVFTGESTLTFTTPVTVTPGTTYYLQPVIQSGDSFEVGLVPGSLYPNGMAYLSGTPDSGGDLWFREGIVVPEPSSLSLAIISLAAIFPVLRHRSNPTRKTHEKKTCSEEQPPPHCCFVLSSLRVVLQLPC